MSRNTDEDSLDETTDAPPRSDTPGETPSGSDETTDAPPRSRRSDRRSTDSSTTDSSTTGSSTTDSSTTDSSTTDSGSFGDSIRGPDTGPTLDAVARAQALQDATNDRTDEELAATIRAQTATIDGLGDDIADRLEQGNTDIGGVTIDLLELSHLLVEIAHTVDRAHE